MFGLGVLGSLGVLSGASGFSPASLFAPSDNGVWLAPNDASTLYRNASLTLPARFNGLIKGIKDKSGKGNNAVQISAAEGSIKAGTISAPGSAYTDGTYTNVTITGGTGSGAKGTFVVLGGIVTTATITTPGQGYMNGAILTAGLPAGTGFTWTASLVVASPRWAADTNTNKQCAWFHQGFQALPITFGSALGSNCTVVFANGSSVEFLTGQTIGTTYSIPKTFFQFLIINRALTSDETAALTTYFSAFCPKYTPTYTCYVDASRPDDSGNGLTLATAKKTLLAGFNVLWTQPTGSALGVMPGTYSEQIDSTSVVGISGKTQSMHAIAAGVIMDASEVPNVGTSSAFGVGAGYALEVWGNGNFIVRNYGNNGFGVAGNGLGRIFDSFVSACSNGVTIHATSTVQNERNTVTKCPNGAFAHTGDGSSVFSRFNGYYGIVGAVAGIGLLGEGGTSFDYFGDDFLPDPATTSSSWSACLVASTNAGSLTAPASARKVRNCRFGAPSITPGSVGTAGLHNTTIQDCYLNGFDFQPSGTSVLIQWTRCYGAWSYRPRRTATCVQQWDNCVFNSGSATSSDRAINTVVYSIPSDVFGSGYVKNSIFTGCAVGIFAVSNTAEFNAAFLLVNNLYYNNTLNYTVGLTPDGVDVTGQNPLIIDMTSDEQADWHVSAGSPSLGAGVGGSDIGLGL